MRRVRKICVDKQKTGKLAASKEKDMDAMNGLAFAYESCKHLIDFKAARGSHAFRTVQKFLRPGPSGRTSLKRVGKEIPLCTFCNQGSGRLYACLSCAHIGCCPTEGPSHARAHAQAKPGHELAVDIDRAELFCCVCNDQVYDADFDRAVLCVQVVSSSLGLRKGKEEGNGSGEGPKSVDRKKKRKAEYRPWVPTPEQELAISQGATPLRVDPELPSGLRGLNNLGNTCFMNSVLQALLHTPPLRNYFLSDRHNPTVCQRRATHLCLGCDMDTMFSAAFSGDRTPFSPAQFLYSWWRHAENLAGYEQQDAHEFFISTIDGIHANSGTTSPRVRNSHRAGDVDCRCVVHRVFSGILRSDVTCMACGFTSTTFDPFVDISLDLEPGRSEGGGGAQNSGLGESGKGAEGGEGGGRGKDNAGAATLLGCLDRFTRPERLGTNEKSYCEKCDTRQESIKQLSVRKLPLVLCLHVKRFEHSSTHRLSRKIDRYVQFPLSLDMSPYMSSSIVRMRHGNRVSPLIPDPVRDAPAAACTPAGGLGEDDADRRASANGASASGAGGGGLPGLRTSPRLCASSSLAAQGCTSQYELFALVTHAGKLDSGHYVTYLRLSGQWYKCDDAWVTRVDESVVRGSQGYMLYYVQKTLAYQASETTPPRAKEAPGRTKGGETNDLLPDGVGSANRPSGSSSKANGGRGPLY